LAFLNVVRQKIDQQGGDPLDELLSLRKRPDIARYAGILARQVLERRDVIGIRQKANIEHQVAIGWNSMAVTEAGDMHQNAGGAGVLGSKRGMDGLAQLVNVEFAGIDDGIG